MSMTRLTNKSTEELLELVLAHMQNMDRRDYWRTVGGFFQGFFTMIPMLLFLVSTWYLYAYRDTILQNITEQVTTQISHMMPQFNIQNAGNDIFKKVQQNLMNQTNSSGSAVSSQSSQ